MKKKPITTAEYFDLICKLLEDKGLMPDDILDYRLGASHPVPIRTYEFSIRNNLDYGGSEGIYLDLAIECWEERGQKIKELGIFKTLDDTPEAMRIMAKLLADFIVEERAYVNAHLDDFTWTGMEVYAINEGGVRYGWGYSCANEKNAIKCKDELLKKHPRVAIRDNATRTETIYENESLTQEES